MTRPTTWSDHDQDHADRPEDQTVESDLILHAAPAGEAAPAEPHRASDLNGGAGW